MQNLILKNLMFGLFLAGMLSSPLIARTVDPPGGIPRTSLPEATTGPAYCASEHNVGRMIMPVTNAGVFGRGLSAINRSFDCFTGNALIGFCEFPKRSYNSYMFGGGLWVGAVVGRDTLVSASIGGTGREFHPAEAPFGELIYRSNLDALSPRFEGAVSEQDFISVVQDTCTNCPQTWADFVDSRPHRPLGVEVRRSSYAWSYAYCQDLVIFDYSIKNIGKQRLREIYLGMFVDADVTTTLPLSHHDGATDDLCGFREYQPAFYMNEPCPPDSDQVNMAWLADNDGDFDRPQTYVHVPHVTGARIIRTPNDTLRVSFNWWSSNMRTPRLDFGPQARKSFREMPFGNLGTPWGDRDKYHFLRNGERDYDQAVVSTIGNLDPTWVQPPSDWIDEVVSGLDCRYLLSFGPFGLDPGQTLPFTMAYMAGANFHRRADNIDNLPLYPELWYNNVNFDSLGRNAMWAEWIFDNPGVDTDSDGYAGEFTVCNLTDDSTVLCDTLVDTSADPDTNYVHCYWAYDVADTIWRKGDGIPDFRGATPPPNPSIYGFVNQYGDTCRGLRVFPDMSTIRVRWNGVESENTADPFTHKYDFEGYRVYLGRDDRSSSFSVADSYDRENYNRWVWSSTAGAFVLRTTPFTLEELRRMYADSSDLTWHPDQYPRTQPLIIHGGSKLPDKIYFFEPQGFNRSVLANNTRFATTDIRKVYPNAPRPSHVHPDSIAIFFPNRDDTLYFTELGYLKYYEYEYVFENILATVPYYVNVTAFDFGFPELGLAGLETDPALRPKAVYPLPSSEIVAADNLGVFIYPNPYRIDGNYRDRGLEAREKMHVPEDKTRLVHFANLPPKCTIRIHSIDGDLIGGFDHDVDPMDYLANHDTWNLINKNMQLVVSGLYYWTVEDDLGNTQIGKLVVIM